MVDLFPPSTTELSTKNDAVILGGTIYLVYLDDESRDPGSAQRLNFFVRISSNLTGLLTFPRSLPKIFWIKFAAYEAGEILLLVEMQETEDSECYVT